MSRLLIDTSRAGARQQSFGPSLASPWPTTVLWRWRYELAILIGAPLAFWLGAVRIGTYLLGTVVACLLAVVLLSGPLRRVAYHRLMCVVTPHRIRTGLAQSWVHNRKGRLPMIVWTRPTWRGEDVLIWLPAGVCEQHVVGGADVLRSACWARRIEISTETRHRNLVTIHVVRRG